MPTSGAITLANSRRAQKYGGGIGLYRFMTFFSYDWFFKHCPGRQWLNRYVAPRVLFNFSAVPGTTPTICTNSRGSSARHPTPTISWEPPVYFNNLPRWLGLCLTHFFPQTDSIYKLDFYYPALQRIRNTKNANPIFNQPVIKPLL